MVTGGLVAGPGAENYNTEIYEDNAWRTASALPLWLWAGRAITLNNVVLHFGNDKQELNSMFHEHNR